jgi:hypothetical protein
MRLHVQQKRWDHRDSLLSRQVALGSLYIQGDQQGVLTWKLIVKRERLTTSVSYTRNCWSFLYSALFRMMCLPTLICQPSPFGYLRHGY